MSSVPSELAAGRPQEAPYRGRFAPSPTGPLHIGSLVAALASWLDARAHAGAWLVRIEDLDPPREVPGATDAILALLGRCGLHADAPVLRQRDRGPAYAAALARLARDGRAYPCTCSRRDAELRAQAAGLPAGVYPGTCRPPEARRAAFDASADDPALTDSGRAPAWRLRLDGSAVVRFVDRWCGTVEQDVRHAAGDVVLRRADGLWAYQLAVVVDDAAQGITDVVRGDDLLDNTPRQILLQRALGLATPRYLHVPVVRAADGRKLSKQTGAAAVAPDASLAALRVAARHLGLPVDPRHGLQDLLASAVAAWRERHGEGGAAAGGSASRPTIA